MATLNNPVNKQNIVDRFSDFVTFTVNNSIVWGLNNRPSGYFTSTFLGYEPFGGNTTGKPIAISGANITDTVITAGTIYNVLLQETQRYSNIRNMRALINVTGTGGNTPLGPEVGGPGIIYDVTAKANMSDSFLQSLVPVANAGVASGSNVSAAGLESFFSNLRTQYNNYQASVVAVQVNVCHSSCHSSCHASRSRR